MEQTEYYDTFENNLLQAILKSCTSHKMSPRMGMGFLVLITFERITAALSIADFVTLIFIIVLVWDCYFILSAASTGSSASALVVPPWLVPTLPLAVL